MNARQSLRSSRLAVNESLRRRGELRLVDLAGAVAALAQFADAGGLDVVADGGVAPAELDGERQADVAQADHADLEVSQVEFAHARAGAAFRADGSVTLAASREFAFVPNT